MGSITGKNSLGEHFEVFRTITAKDNVLTPASHKAFAKGLAKEASSLLEGKSKRKHSDKVSLCSAEWHGFISNVGVGKTCLKVSKSLTVKTGLRLSINLCACLYCASMPRLFMKKGHISIAFKACKISNISKYSFKCALYHRIPSSRKMNFLVPYVSYKNCTVKMCGDYF
jgi:hypothetical protein